MTINTYTQDKQTVSCLQAKYIAAPKTKTGSMPSSYTVAGRPTVSVGFGKEILGGNTGL